jgi:DNA-binding transcriptional LysR family regulator
MEMHQIQYFVALCEESSFTRVAYRCGVSQPTVTTGIRALEKELGAPLFDRKPRIRPTELGRAIYPLLQDIVRKAAHARETARALTSPLAAAVPDSLGAMSAVAAPVNSVVVNGWKTERRAESAARLIGVDKSG